MKKLTRKSIVLGVAMALTLFTLACGDGGSGGGGGGGSGGSGGGGTPQWTAVSNSTFDIYHPILAIAYGNGKFVAGGGGVV